MSEPKIEPGWYWIKTDLNEWIIAEYSGKSRFFGDDDGQDPPVITEIGERIERESAKERPKYNRDRIQKDIEHWVSIELDAKTMSELIDFTENVISLTKWFSEDDERESGWVSVPYQLCPKCNGQGIVSFPPFAPGDAPSAVGTEIAYTCGVCEGKKIIPQFVPPAPEK